ncbi:MAG: hypothetical protein KIT11_09195 [Fimbriimonadaceae bacterium]|nr:hypothetical protein [Fimbriimonadaceae bacterium]QYK55503.1 MAG: hypothetical protein KF733_10865 [Fimbriimonadaceae bacterium]
MSTSANALSAAVPLAYGTVAADGSRLSGTTNWTCTYDAATQRYLISIDGVAYFMADQTTIVTAVNTSTFFTTVSSFDGMVVVHVRNGDGDPVQKAFSFVTYWANGRGGGRKPSHAYGDDSEWAVAEPAAFSAFLGSNSGA